MIDSLLRFYCGDGSQIMYVLLACDLAASVAATWLMKKQAANSYSRISGETNSIWAVAFSWRFIAYVWTFRFLHEGSGTMKCLCMIAAGTAITLVALVLGLFVVSAQHSSCPA